LPAGDRERLAALIELVLTDLECRLKAGEPARVEPYLRRYPELGRDREVVLALVTHELRLQVWDAESGRQLFALRGHTDTVWCVAFSPDGGRLATAGWDRTVRLWDAQTGRQLQKLEGHAEAVWSVCFSGDGRRLASGGEDRTVRVWDADGGHQLLSLGGHRHWTTSVCFSPDDGLLASASYDKTVRLWDAEPGR
jgi:WD40 repeat protein